MTVTARITTINDAEIATNWATPTNFNSDDGYAQGAGSVGAKISNSTTYLAYQASGYHNLTDKYLYVWFNAKSPVDTQNNGGLRILVGNSGNTTNYGVWYVAGSNNYLGGWKCYAVRCNLSLNPFDTAVGTPPSSLTGISVFGGGFKTISKINGNFNNCNIDAIRYGDGLVITDGTTGTPVTLADILTYDEGTTNNRFGIVSDVGGAILVQGKLQIGSGTGVTVFNDNSKNLVFISHRKPEASGIDKDYFSDGDFSIDITGVNTQVTLGQKIGAGSSSLGVAGFNINSPAATGTTGVRPRQSLNVYGNVAGLKLYGLNFGHGYDINIGNENTSVSGSKIELIDCNFNDCRRIKLNIDEQQGGITAYRAKAITSIDTTGSFALLGTGTQGTINLSGVNFAALNSNVFLSQNNTATGTFNVYEFDFSSDTGRYVTVYQNKTWNFVNSLGFSVNTGNQNQLNFSTTTGTQVNERYSLILNINDTAGADISGARVYLYEGFRTRDFSLSGSSNSAGDYSQDWNFRSFTSNGASALNQVLDSGHVLRIYKYGKSPFVGSIASNAKYDVDINLIADAAITEASESTALSNGAGITVTKHASGYLENNPVRVIHYDGGVNTLSVGNVVKGVTSSATGTVIEFVGDSTEGTLVVSGWNGISFTNNETINNTPSAGTWTALADTAGGASSFQESYTWLIRCDSKSLSNTYDYLAAKMAQNPIDSIFAEAIRWGQSEQTQLFYSGPQGYYTSRNSSLAQGVWIANRGGGTVDYFTADTGNTFTPPVSVTFELTNLVTGSEVRVYQSGTTTEIAGTDSSTTTFQYAYIYGGSDTPIVVYVHNTNYEWLSLRGLTLGNTNQSIPVQQRSDRNYANP